MIARAIIMVDSKILLIHRHKNGKEYYTLPGGHMEQGESQEETVIREVKEETSLDIKIDRKLRDMRNPYDDSRNHFFLASIISGELALGGPELERQSEQNHYSLEWHDVKTIPTLAVVPEILKQNIINLIATTVK